MPVITAAPISGPTLSLQPSRGAGERSDSVVGAEQAAVAPALYGSPRIRFDRDAATLVIEIRDVQSGEIEQSIPDRAILEAYRRAALTGAPVPGEFKSREEAPDPAAAAAAEALSAGQRAGQQALRALGDAAAEFEGRARADRTASALGILPGMAPAPGVRGGTSVTAAFPADIVASGSGAAPFASAAVASAGVPPATTAPPARVPGAEASRGVVRQA